MGSKRFPLLCMWIVGVAGELNNVRFAIYEITAKFSYQLYYIRNEAALSKLMYNEIYVSEWELYEQFLRRNRDRETAKVLECNANQSAWVDDTKKVSSNKHIHAYRQYSRYVYVLYHVVIDVMDLIAPKFLTVDLHMKMRLNT